MVLSSIPDPPGFYRLCIVVPSGGCRAGFSPELVAWWARGSVRAGWVAAGYLSANGCRLKLAEMESSAVNEMFVILSDIWLDHDETMAKLETVLDGYEDVEVVPSLLCLWEIFVHVGLILHIILCQLSGPSKVLPRCALPKYLTEELRKHIPNVIFASNPYRYICNSFLLVIALITVFVFVDNPYFFVFLLVYIPL
ncbi:putative DNA-directed DNA polymerase [Helianthus anomalus]